REDHEFPRHALALSRLKLVLQPGELRPAEHGPRWIVAPRIVRGARPLVTVRAIVDHDDSRRGTPRLAEVIAARTVQTRVTRARHYPVPQRLEFRKRLHARHEAGCLVDEGVAIGRSATLGVMRRAGVRGRDPQLMIVSDFIQAETLIHVAEWDVAAH